MKKIVSICKSGKRYDMIVEGPIELKKVEEAKPTITEGAIVTLNGHKGKVLGVNGEVATVSWEDASQSEVKVGDLTYDSRVEKGGPGSGRYPAGSGSKGQSNEDLKRDSLNRAREKNERARLGDKEYDKRVKESKQGDREESIARLRSRADSERDK